jgi:3-hydroxyisobutyrate dehydrogenase-like beta-hydroxyacid dehydrogenase
MKIGFCGLGLMGEPMVERLLAAGHELLVWNRSREKLQNAVTAGARAAATPADAAKDSEIVVVCLFDSAAVEQVVFGDSGIASVRGPRYLVDHSSISPASTRDFAKRLSEANGAEWVDAPVSGGVAGAKDGRLTVMAGASAEAMADLAVPIGAYAARFARVGPVGAGQTAKLCNQTIVTTTLIGIAEAVRLAQRNGIDASQLPKVLEGGWADSILLRTFARRMVEPPSDKVGSIATLLKDSRMIGRTAEESGTSMPVGSVVREVLTQLTEHGWGDADLSRLIEEPRMGEPRVEGPR